MRRFPARHGWLIAALYVAATLVPLGHSLVLGPAGFEACAHGNSHADLEPAEGSRSPCGDGHGDHHATHCPLCTLAFALGELKAVLGQGPRATVEADLVRFHRPADPFPRGLLFLDGSRGARAPPSALS